MGPESLGLTWSPSMKLKTMTWVSRFVLSKSNSGAPSEVFESGPGVDGAHVENGMETLCRAGDTGIVLELYLSDRYYGKAANNQRTPEMSRTMRIVRTIEAALGTTLLDHRVLAIPKKTHIFITQILNIYIPRPRTTELPGRPFKTRSRGARGAYPKIL
jgi:hypothetical protein